jgi:hypothetical protein
MLECHYKDTPEPKGKKVAITFEGHGRNIQNQNGAIGSVGKLKGAVWAVGEIGPREVRMLSPPDFLGGVLVLQASVQSHSCCSLVHARRLLILPRPCGGPGRVRQS